MKLDTAARPYTQRARAQAAEATAQRIVDAFLARLMNQWFDEITLDSVAQDAGVTVQTVVRRFGGKEGLLSSAVEMLGAQINARRDAPTGELDRLVENLVNDYEQTGDAVIRLLALEPRHAALQGVLEFGRREHRQWVGKAFAEQLSKVREAARKEALDALVLTTDVYIWKLLRRDMGQSVAATENMITSLIEATLTQFTHTKLKHTKPCSNQ